MSTPSHLEGSLKRNLSASWQSQASGWPRDPVGADPARSAYPPLKSQVCPFVRQLPKPDSWLPVAKSKLGMISSTSLSGWREEAVTSQGGRRLSLYSSSLYSCALLPIPFLSLPSCLSSLLLFSFVFLYSILLFFFFFSSSRKIPEGILPAQSEKRKCLQTIPRWPPTRICCVHMNKTGNRGFPQDGGWGVAGAQEPGVPPTMSRVLSLWLNHPVCLLPPFSRPTCRINTL